MPKNYFLTAVIAFASLTAHADPSPLYWFQGADLGYGRIGPMNYPEQSRDGTQLNLKTQGSYYSRTLPVSLVSDLGLGWQWGSRSGYYANNTYAKTITRGFFLEAQTRWIFKPSPSTRNLPSFQVGPLLLYSMTGDVGLGNGTFTADQEKKALYLGIQGIYEFPAKQEWLHRVGIKIAQDVNIPNRNTLFAQLTYQLGFPVLGYLFQDPKTRPLPIVHKDRPLKRFRLVLDGRNIEFDTNRASLRPDSLARIQTTGRFLKSNLDKWEKLVISGHTDERGTTAYNQRLSENRARSVKNALSQGGVPESRMLVRGFSENRPLDDRHEESAWQKNRRVEFDFSGVSSVDVLSRGLFDSTSVEGVELEDSMKP
jgi:outer membrane protein OmpA-like peptidoglycan-associated protein